MIKQIEHSINNKNKQLIFFHFPLHFIQLEGLHKVTYMCNLHVYMCIHNYSGGRSEPYGPHPQHMARQCSLSSKGMLQLRD